LTANNTNQEIFSIDKRKRKNHFCSKKNSNNISKFNDDFSKDFFEVLHISVDQKIKILGTRPHFLTFSAKLQKFF
jgi:hypothetical protein